MTAPPNTSTPVPGKHEIERIVAALRAAAKEKALDPALRSSLATLEARLSTHLSSTDPSPAAGAIQSDMQAARSALSWFQYKDEALASFAEQKRDIEKQATRQGLQRYIDRKARYYLWVLLVVAGFLAFLTISNIVLQHG